MHRVSSTEWRRNLARYIDDVCTSGTVLHVTRHDADAVVMMSASEFESMMETLRMLADPHKAARVLASMTPASARGEHVALRIC